jgi:hypothetical protein
MKLIFRKSYDEESFEETSSVQQRSPLQAMCLKFQKSNSGKTCINFKIKYNLEISKIKDKTTVQNSKNPDQNS